MKKADIMLTFLFYAIIGLLFFIPTVLYGAKLLKLSDNAIDSFSNLAKIVSSVRDDEIASAGFYMDEKSVIVGFAKNSNRFENHEFHYDPSNRDSIVFILNRPKECEADKVCICLCKDFDFPVTSAEQYNPACEKQKCESFDNIDLFSERIVSRFGNGKTQYYWKGGFLHLRSVPAVANGLVQNRLAIRTFYIQRYKSIIDVCLESPCITDEMKKQIN